MTSTARSIESLTTAQTSPDRVLDELLIRGGSQDSDKSRPVESTAAGRLKWRERSTPVTVIRRGHGAETSPEFSPAEERPPIQTSRSRARSRWPRTIRIRQDASVTTAKPAIAVARDQIIDRVADQPWDEVEDPCPLPARKLARNAQ